MINTSEANVLILNATNANYIPTTATWSEAEITEIKSENIFWSAENNKAVEAAAKADAKQREAQIAAAAHIMEEARK